MSTEPLLTSDVIGLTKVAPFSRRGFMTASAAVAAGYTLAAGPVRADVIKTDTDGLTAGDAKIKVADGEMPGYFARPNGVSNPPVVLVAMEIFGLHEYIKDVTRRLAKLGAFAIAPDYYFRKGVDLTNITDIPQLLPIVNSKPDAELLSDLDSTVAWAKSQGGDTGRLGIIGFCRGGRTVWEYAAHSGALKAGVAFYGPPVDPPNPLWPKSPTQLASEMKAPVLGLYGEADTGIPVATVEALKVHPQLNAVINAETSEVTYHDAEHLGIAVDTQRGLIVPVIHSAGDLNIGGNSCSWSARPSRSARRPAPSAAPGRSHEECCENQDRSQQR